MTYEEMCRWVVANEGCEWDDFVSRNAMRKAELVEVRQICFYFGWKYYKSLSYAKMGRIFGKDHATVLHAIKMAKRDLAVEGDFKRKMITYDRGLSDILQTYRLKQDDQVITQLLTSIDQMKIIAEAYCKITGKKII